MVRRTAGRIKRMLKGSTQKPEHNDMVSHHTFVPEVTRPLDPVENYYRHKAETNLPVFYRFALQTRSISIRDTFAKASSAYGVDLESLLGLIKECSKGALGEIAKKQFLGIINTQIILSLADLLANTARDDLDTNRAVVIYDFVAEYFGTEIFEENHRLQYVEALHELGRYPEAERLAELLQIDTYAPMQTDLLGIHKARRTLSIDRWLETLNRAYDSVNLSRVKLSDQDTLPVLDRLRSAVTTQSDGPKISVIMPTYAPGNGIFTAVRSLLDQTWQNFEIIVVNDASPQSFDETFRQVESLDPRITVLHQEVNAGSYVARNRGLSIATGDFVTTHDDDDWSHPDKLARQVQALIDDANIIATTSGHIRTSPDLHFRRVNMKAQYLQMNYSSLMFRREVVDVIGPWDTVNRGGDSEFYTRLKEYFGGERIIGIHDVPLSFSRVWDGSLTSGEMSRGYFAYSRLLYRWSFRQWHWDTKKQGRHAIRRLGDERPYAIPTTFEAGKRNHDLGHFDVVYVTDFFRQAKYVDFVLNEIETLVKKGLKVGYMHLRSPETDRPAGFPQRLFELQHDHQITQIAQDDIADTKILIVYGSAVGMFADQFAAKITSNERLLIDHTLPTLARTDQRNAAAIYQSLENLQHAFGKGFRVVGTTQTEHSILSESLPGSRTLADWLVWREHVRESPGQVMVPTEKAVVGFHSFGNKYRWPDSVEEFHSVYQLKSYDTHILGSLDMIRQNFGPNILDGIAAYDHNEIEMNEFLETIDFWVYSPHSKLVDRVWTPVLEAMNAGKVVLLPERLRSIYGDAAVYFASDTYSEIIEKYASDELEYIKQASKGQSFVNQYFSESSYMHRVLSLLKQGQ